MSLCIACKKFDIQPFSSSAQRWRNIPMTNVEKGAHGGCRFCKLLLDSLQSEIARCKSRNPPHVVRIYFYRDVSRRLRWMRAEISSSSLPTSEQCDRDRESWLYLGKLHLGFHVIADKGRSPRDNIIVLASTSVNQSLTISN